MRNKNALAAGVLTAAIKAAGSKQSQAEKYSGAHGRRTTKHNNAPHAFGQHGHTESNHLAKSAKKGLRGDNVFK